MPHGLAMFYSDRKQFEKAAEWAGKALQIEDRAETRNLLGRALEANAQIPEAVEQFQRAIRLNRYDESYYFDLAQVLLRHEQFDAAAAELEASRKIFAKSPQLELALGVAYYALRKFDGAVDCFLRVITVAPDVPQAYEFLGRIIDQSGSRLDEAIAHFGAYAKAAPGSYMSQFLYAKALNAKSGPADTIERLLRRSIELNGMYWESHFELGTILEKKKQWLDAASELSRAVELNPNNSAPHYRLARVYDRLGRPEEAHAERALHMRLQSAETAAAALHPGAIERVELQAK